jgi:hypothetical protein
VFVTHFSDICKGLRISFNLVNHAAASPWLRRSWSPNYLVLVLILILILILRMIHFFLGFPR